MALLDNLTDARFQSFSAKVGKKVWSHEIQGIGEDYTFKYEVFCAYLQDIGISFYLISTTPET